MIVALTPNLCLDRALVRGALHRAPQVQVQAGGKGVNLARAVRAFGGAALVAGVVGGHNGRRFADLLRGEGLEGVLAWGEGETRECHILLDRAAHPTEINEAGFPVGEELWTEVLGRLPAGTLRTDTLRADTLSTDTVALCGSIPPGMTPRAFGALVKRLGSPVVDTSGPALLEALACGASPVKPNEHELAQLAGTASVASAQDLRRRYGADVLLTLGERGAVLVSDSAVSASAPSVEVKNPVGSGDTLLGTFLWAREQGEAPGEALRLAVAAGAANALLGGPRQFRAEVARALVGQVRVETGERWA